VDVGAALPIHVPGDRQTAYFHIKQSRSRLSSAVGNVIKVMMYASFSFFVSLYDGGWARKKGNREDKRTLLVDEWLHLTHRNINGFVM
jgi:hypothetical protein